MHEEAFREVTREQVVEFAGNAAGALRVRDVERQAARHFQHGQVRSAWHVGTISPAELMARARAAEATALPALPPTAGRWQGTFGKAFGPPDAFYAEVQATLAGLDAGIPGVGCSGRAVRRQVERSLDGCALEAFVTHWAVTFKQHGSPHAIDGYFEATSVDPGVFAATLAHYRPYLAALGRPAALPPGGRLPVMYLDPGPALLNRITESLRVDRQQGGASLFGGRLGEPLFHPEVGLDDVSLEPAWGQLAPFDGEGTVRPAPRLALIERGVPVRAIAHTDSGARYGVPTTGNARRVFGEGVTLDFHALALHRGPRPYQDVLAGLPRCIVVLAAIGGTTTPMGDYSAPVNLAFLVEHGEVAGRLPPLTLTAPVQEVFGSRWLAAAADGFGPAMPHPCIFAEMDHHLH